ncbi:MAG: serine/threonine protein kinase [Proteobacteria bacterium]|nr:serine/threonine protein kinase [Pseudomonadota bacterium]
MPTQLQINTALPAGTLFSERYRILSLLGRGGMAIVYHAHDITTHKEVALKLPFLSRSYPLEHFVREVEIHSRMDSPYIARVYNYCTNPTEGAPYLALEYLAGPPLSEILGATKLPSVDRRLQLLIQVALGLAHIHEQGIIHRDITPGNILVVDDREAVSAKIIDFGASIQADAQVKDGRSEIIGTPYYMSPEQSRGKILDARSDIYSFGVLGYELLTGKKAFELEREYEDFLEAHHLKLRHIAGRIPSVRDKNRRVSRFVSTLFEVCMQKKRQYRYESVAEIAEKLSQARELEIDPSAWGRLKRIILG